jgi:fido (protein-threonine AMPylation protein)
MNQLEFTWAKDFAAAQDLSSLAFAFAKFYYAFIAIHPFVDGNQRTAIKFIEDVALDRGYQMQPTPLLRKVHLQGNVPEELKKLTIVFYQALGESK